MFRLGLFALVSCTLLVAMEMCVGLHVAIGPSNIRQHYHAELCTDNSVLLRAKTGIMTIIDKWLHGVT